LQAGARGGDGRGGLGEAREEHAPSVAARPGCRAVSVGRPRPGAPELRTGPAARGVGVTCPGGSSACRRPVRRTRAPSVRCSPRTAVHRRRPMKAAQYDAFAARYDAENASSMLNAHYERPAMLSLAGEVRGRRVLDAGCGSGPLAAELLRRGAVVTGLDASPAMVELARRRLGDDVPLHVGDLA